MFLSAQYQFLFIGFSAGVLVVRPVVLVGGRVSVDVGVSGNAVELLPVVFCVVVATVVVVVVVVVVVEVVVVGGGIANPPIHTEDPVIQYLRLDLKE